MLIQELLEMHDSLMRIMVQSDLPSHTKFKPVDSEFMGNLKRRLEQHGKIVSSAIAGDKQSVNISLVPNEGSSRQLVLDTILPFLTKFRYSALID